MSDPKVVVAFDAEGVARVKKELGATDAQLEKVNGQLKRLNERAALQELKNQSEAFRAAQERLAKAQGRLTQELSRTERALNSMGKAANSFNEIRDAAGSLIGVASGLADSANELAMMGAVARDVAGSFSALGDAAPSMERLKSATAGVVDDTTLQGYAKLAAEVGLSSDEIESLAQRATVLAAEHGKLAETGDILNKMIKGEAEGLRELGVVVDLSSSQFAGLTESEKKLAIAQEQATLGTQAQVDAIDSAQASILQQTAAWENLKSQAASAFSEFLEGSGILDALGDAIKGVSEWAEENRSLIEKLGNAVSSIFNAAMSIAGNLAGTLASTLEVLAPALEVAAKGIELFADALSWDMGTAVSETLLTDIPFATSNLGDFNKVVEDTLNQLRQAKELAEGAATARANDLSITEKALKAQERLSSFVEDYNGNLDMSASAWVNQNKNLDTALDKIGDMRGELEQHIDLVESQTEAERAYGAVAAANTSAARIEDLDRLERAIIDQAAAEAQSIRDAEAAKEAAEKAERAREESRRKRQQNAAMMQAERFRTFESAYAAEMAQLDLIIEAEERELDILSRRNAAIAWYKRIQEEAAPAIKEAIDRAKEKNEQDEIAAEKVAKFNEARAGQIEAMSEMARAGSLMAVSIGGVTDKWDALSDAVIGSAEAFKLAKTDAQKFGATLAAGKAITGAVVDDTTTQAAILGAFEVAESAAAFAGLNPIAGAAHAAAAALYFGVAAKGGKGGKGGGGGGAAGDAAVAAPAVADIAEEPTLPGRGSGQTVIFNVESINPEGAGDSVMRAINSFSEAGGGNLIDPSAIGTQQGRSGR